MAKVKEYCVLIQYCLRLRCSVFGISRICAKNIVPNLFDKLCGIIY